MRLTFTAPPIDRPASALVRAIVRVPITTGSAPKMVADDWRSTEFVQLRPTLVVGVDSDDSLEAKFRRVASITMPSGSPTSCAPWMSARIAV